MMLDGISLANEIKDSVKKEISSKKLAPGLATILVGNDPASELYVHLKLKSCFEVGIKGELHHLPANATEAEVLSKIQSHNNNPNIHGILVQLPLPKHLNTPRILNSINPRKDVDGLHSNSMGEIVKGNERLASCTPKAVIALLEKYKIPVEGKEVVVIGRSMEVGKPLALMLINRGATVTVCHSKTKDISAHTKKADIVISCTGVPGLVKGSMIKKDSVVIDVGISKVNGKIKGDVETSSVAKKAAYLSPVPGGVGPVTVAMLLKNTLLACQGDKK